ncbi:hypothetical protein ACEQ8H_002202 [Pleosporales sp. CAS-2024a]
MERSTRSERGISFNPEAATFSPTTVPAGAAEIPSTDTGVLKENPLGFGSPPSTFQAAAHMWTAEDRAVGSPMQSGQTAHATPAEEGNSASQQITIHALLAQENPRQLLISAIQEKSFGSLPSLMNPSTGTYSHPAQTLDYTAARQPIDAVSSQRTGSGFNMVDIDELSAGLGLPGAKQEPTLDDSPARSHRSRASQGVSEALYGKLIYRALNKPLTPHTLAHYMNNRSGSEEETVKPSHGQYDPFVDQVTPLREQEQSVKFVHAPPGFGMHMPRQIIVEEQNMMQASSGDMYHDSASSHMGTPQQSRARYQSSRRRLQTYTRTKRSDQGPEPSAADIYPEDAHFTPRPSTYQRQHYFPASPYMPLPIVKPDDAASWPTPAEVYTAVVLPRTPTVAHVPQQLAPREPQAEPAPHHLTVADKEVLSLVHGLFDPSNNTLITPKSLDFLLVGEERSLSPNQLSGKRYGITYGIGLGNMWQPPSKPSWGNSGEFRNEAFRVRPRDHEGWGGWEWAMGKGWAHEHE